MAQAIVTAVPLSVVYPDSYFEGEIPQGTNNDIDSDDDQLNPRKRKASFSGGANNDEDGSSSDTGDPSAPPPTKESKLNVDLNDLAKEWDIIVKEVKEIMIKNNVAFQARKKKLDNKYVGPLNLLRLLILLMKVMRFKAQMLKTKVFSCSIIVWTNNTGF